jgi:hypothetical protein
VCDDPTFCDDGDPTTVDTCDDTNLSGGCCEHQGPPRQAGCRITAGRTNRLDKIENGVEGPRGQGGGQVGAPCGCTGCFTTGDPEADLAFEHIQGNWQYTRKYPKADQFKQGTFHAKDFNSLICGCCDEDLPNCTEGGTFQTPNAGACFNSGADSGFSDGQVCGDRTTGPTPPTAQANIICFSGIGDWVDTNGRKIDQVAFRVEAQDRSEPSVGKNADETCDYHRIRIWIPAGTCSNNGNPCASDAGCNGNATCTISQAEQAAFLADAACCTTANDSSGNVPGIRLPNIDDGGNLIHGNIQIHEELNNTTRGRCPVPDGSCQQ